MFHDCLLKVTWVTLDPCTSLLGGRHWFGIRASTVLCAARGVLQNQELCKSACVQSPDRRISCKRKGRKGKLQERKGLVPLQPYSWEKHQRPCWARSAGQRVRGALSDTEHKPHVVGSWKHMCVCVHIGGRRVLCLNIAWTVCFY